MTAVAFYKMWKAVKCTKQMCPQWTKRHGHQRRFQNANIQTLYKHFFNLCKCKYTHEKQSLQFPSQLRCRAHFWKSKSVISMSQHDNACNFKRGLSQSWQNSGHSPPSQASKHSTFYRQVLIVFSGGTGNEKNLRWWVRQKQPVSIRLQNGPTRLCYSEARSTWRRKHKQTPKQPTLCTELYQSLVVFYYV
jgi:hypothetical protein